MSGSKLNAEIDFLVKECKTINFVTGGALIVVFVFSMTFEDYGWSNYLTAVCLFLIPGAIAIAKGRKNLTIIKINKTGFFYGEKLVTEWNLYYDAVVHNKMQVGSYRDNFILDLRYYSVDYSLLYTISIPLTNNQDKGDEEIIEAINFFYGLSRLKAPEQLSTLTP